MPTNLKHDWSEMDGNEVVKQIARAAIELLTHMAETTWRDKRDEAVKLLRELEG